MEEVLLRDGRHDTARGKMAARKVWLFIRMCLSIRFRSKSYLMAFFAATLFCLALTNPTGMLQVGGSEDGQDLVEIPSSKAIFTYIGAMAANQTKVIYPNSSLVSYILAMSGVPKETFAICNSESIMLNDISKKGFSGIAVSMVNSGNSIDIATYSSSGEIQPIWVLSAFSSAAAASIIPNISSIELFTSGFPKSAQKNRSLIAVSAFYAVFSMQLISIRSLQFFQTFLRDPIFLLLSFNGLSDFAIRFGSAALSVIELIPCFFCTLFSLCFKMESLNKSSIPLFNIALMNFVCSHSLQCLWLGCIFFREAWAGVPSFFISLFSIFGSIICFDVQTGNISSLIRRTLCILSPECSLSLFIGICDQEQSEGNPLSFRKMSDRSIECIILQFLNFLFEIIAYSLTSLCAQRENGVPPLKWSQICSIQKWRKLFKSDECFVEPSISISHIFKSYSREPALDDVTLSISPQEFVVVIGANGSGKTTLLKAIEGVITTDSGNIEIFGSNNISRDSIGVVFQSNTLINDLSVKEHFLYFGEFCGRQAGDSDFTEYLDRKAKDLSEGTKRRLCIALALIKMPSLIILDEPTAGIDAISRRSIWKLLGSMKNSTVLVSTHSLEGSETFCSRLVVMRHGAIAFSGTTSELRDEYKCNYRVILSNGNIECALSTIRKCIPEAEISDGAIELPADIRVADALQELEKRKEELCINSYCVRIQSLEETLIKVINADEVTL